MGFAECVSGVEGGGIPEDEDSVECVLWRTPVNDDAVVLCDLDTVTIVVSWCVTVAVVPLQEDECVLARVGLWAPERCLCPCLRVVVECLPLLVDSRDSAAASAELAVSGVAAAANTELIGAELDAAELAVAELVVSTAELVVPAADGWGTWPQ